MKVIPAKPLSLAELRKHPARMQALRLPRSQQSGTVTVAKGRDGPFELYHEVFGTGPAKLVFICGHGAPLGEWRRQMLDFGVSGAEK